MLKAEAKRLGRNDPPSEKTVRTYAKIQREAPEHERRQYRLVYWPESFGTPELPWEAAPAVFEAIRMTGEESRPTVRTAKWYWRLFLAAPDMAPKDRLRTARQMAAVEVSDLPRAAQSWRLFEWKMLHPGVVPPEPLPIWTSIDVAEEEGVLTPSVAEAIRESRRQRKLQQEGEPADERPSS
ncbi:MAG: hypothetical protein ACM3US_02395 [Sphingomonadaceae bacterium]